MSEDRGLIKRRRIAGIVCMALGVPNLIMGMAMTLGGIGAAILLGVLAYGAYNSEPGDNPLANVCMALLLVIFIALLVAAVIFTVIAIIFALAMAGQSIGGYFAFKGINFRRTVAFVFMGSFIALVVGVVLLVWSLSADADQNVRTGALIFGIFEMLSFAGTLVSGILISTTKRTFTTKKGKGLLRGRKKKRS